MKIPSRRRPLLLALASIVALVPVLFAACDDDGSAGRNTPPAGEPTVSFTLSTTSDDGLAFVGVGDAIDGVRNPMLQVEAGDIVEVTLENGDGVEHDISFPDFGATAQRLSQVGTETTLTFEAAKEGRLKYFCTVPGHREAGMEGDIVVGENGNA